MELSHFMIKDKLVSLINNGNRGANFNNCLQFLLCLDIYALLLNLILIHKHLTNAQLFFVSLFLHNNESHSGILKFRIRYHY